MYQEKYNGVQFVGELALTEVRPDVPILVGNLREDYTGRAPNNTQIGTDCLTGMIVDDENQVVVATDLHAAYAMVGPLVDHLINSNKGLKDMWDAAVAAYRQNPPEFSAVKYPSTGQFRNILRHAKNIRSFAGLDQNGEAMYRPGPYEPIEFEGTVKIHGTNGTFFLPFPGAPVVFQSKEQILSLDSDNSGFYAKYQPHNDKIVAIFEKLADRLIATGLQENEIYPLRISGEWAGNGIQRGVAVSEVDRFFAVVGAAYGPKGEQGQTWVPSAFVRGLEDESIRVFDIAKIGGVFSVSLDVENPQGIQNELVEKTLSVEKLCPVGDYFGVQGIGEGIVWKPVDEKLCANSGLWFKVKGDKHSSSKVKTLAEVDPAKLASISEFVEYAVTESRLTQALGEVFADQPLDIKRTGEMLKWVNKDIHKEESDVLEASGLTLKEVGNSVGQKVRTWFFAQLDKEVL